ncbi:MAG: GTP-binding protein [Candidatus Heimdallarchaeota archaeon]
MNEKKARDSSYIFKILLLGEMAVGKTSITLKYVHGKFDSNYLMTVGMEPYSKYVQYGDDETIHLSIWDIAGQRKFRIFTQMFFSGAKGALLVFDLTRPNTLHKLVEWHEELKKYTNKDIVTLLIGNKSDLKDLRLVTTEEAEVFKKKIGAIRFFETSAKTGSYINEAFKIIAEEVLKQIIKNEKISNERKLIEFQDKETKAKERIEKLKNEATNMMSQITKDIKNGIKNEELVTLSNNTIDILSIIIDQINAYRKLLDKKDEIKDHIIKVEKKKEMEIKVDNISFRSKQIIDSSDINESTEIKQNKSEEPLENEWYNLSWEEHYRRRKKDEKK